MRILDFFLDIYLYLQPFGSKRKILRLFINKRTKGYGVMLWILSHIYAQFHSVIYYREVPRFRRFTSNSSKLNSWINFCSCIVVDRSNWVESIVFIQCFGSFKAFLKTHIAVASGLLRNDAHVECKMWVWEVLWAQRGKG